VSHHAKLHTFLKCGVIWEDRAGFQLESCVNMANLVRMLVCRDAWHIIWSDLTADKWAATITSLKGTLTRRAQETLWKRAKVGQS